MAKGPASLPKLSPAQFQVLEDELRKGLAAHGWDDQRWTLARIKTVIGRRFDADPFLLTVSEPEVSAEQDWDRHAPIPQRVVELIVRGRQEGDIDPDLPVNWVPASVFALGSAAGEEVRDGRMSAPEAVAALRVGVPRLIRPTPVPRRRSPRR